MHEELVKRLRNHAIRSDSGYEIGNSMYLDILKAADAIEELSKRVPPVPHGRLIDADALTEMCQEMQRIEWNNKASPHSWAYAYESFEDDIDNAPTIIPASEWQEEETI